MTQGLKKPQTWEDAYLVNFYEVDAKNRILLPNLWKYMQETAWNHANRIGIGYSELSLNDFFWVLSRLTININEYPGWGDRIRVKTWLLESSRLFAFRDFSIVKEDGRIIGGAKSAWVVLNSKTRKPQRIEPFLKELHPLPDQHGGKTALDKLPAPGAPNEETFFTVRYSDLDLNLHVNNSRYIEWILNSYSFEMNQTHHISTLEINFLAESNLGDELSVQSEKQNDSAPAFLHTMIRKADGRELCRARVRWKKVE